jgi:uncharacterized hydrophobic protein (TIGR00341 family)
VKIIEVVADSGHTDTVTGIAENSELTWWLGGSTEDGRQSIRLVVSDAKRQQVLDSLQSVLASTPDARILVIPLEATIPRPTEEAQGEEKEGRSASATREELYHNIEKGARLDANYVLLVVLSTVVAAIGLIEDNVAVVIGAMVIAPLLGPNLALALGTSLGDGALVGRALKTNLLGLITALAASVAIGVTWPPGTESGELMMRTDVGLDSLALALASGAAAVLSLTTGVSTVLVGVMVAVALLPPTATVGLMLGQGEYVLSLGAGLLLVANVVCVNLAANLVFLLKGVKPRTWLEKQKARQSTRVYIGFWIVLLVLVVAVIVVRQVKQ